MDIVLPLESMTIAEKLRAMESLWDDLCRKSNYLDSPSWHGEVISLREQRLTEGKESTLDWDDAKNNIHRSLE